MSVLNLNFKEYRQSRTEYKEITIVMHCIKTQSCWGVSDNPFNTIYPRISKTIPDNKMRIIYE
jgi:hypothetical protein